MWTYRYFISPVFFQWEVSKITFYVRLVWRPFINIVNYYIDIVRVVNNYADTLST